MKRRDPNVLRAGAAAWLRTKDVVPNREADVYGALEHNELDTTSHNLVSEALHWNGFDAFVRAVKSMREEG